MESETLKKYLLGLVENDENHEMFYYHPGQGIFIDSFLPGNYTFQFTEEYPLGAPPKFKADLIECKFGIIILSCEFTRDEYEMFRRAAIDYQTHRGKQVESRLKDILKHWDKDRFYLMEGM